MKSKQQIGNLVLQPMDVKHIGEGMDVFTEQIYEGAKLSKKNDVEQWDISLSRWERLLQNPDQKHIWRAVNWKGEIDSAEYKSDKTPSDDQFKQNFESL